MFWLRFDDMNMIDVKNFLGRNDTTSTKKRRRWEAGEEEESDPHYFEVTLKKHHISRFVKPSNQNH